MSRNYNKQLPQRPMKEISDGLSSLEKGKYSQRRPSVSSTQSSIASLPKAHTASPKPVPPPYYSSAKYTTSPHAFDRTFDLVHTQQRQRRPPSFCRRHWFIIIVVLTIILTCSLAVLGVILQGKKANQTTYLPSQLTQPAEGDPETFSFSVEQATTTMTPRR